MSRKAKEVQLSEDFLNALNDEIVILESELAGNVAFVRWRELQKVRGLYNRLPRVHDGRDGPSQEGARGGSRGPSPERGGALSQVHALLEGRTTPTPTREILSDLLKTGFVIAGRDPVSNLSAMLSKSDEFQSHGRSGWTIRIPHWKSSSNAADDLYLNKSLVDDDGNEQSSESNSENNELEDLDASDNLHDLV